MINFTDDSLKAAVANRSLVVVDFWAPWCGPCKSVMPLVESVANEYKEEATFGKINVDENPDIASQLGIRSIPAVVVFKNGTLVDKLVGQSITANALVETINTYSE